MNAIAAATAAFERLPLPDGISRLAVSALVGRSDRRMRIPGADDAAFARAMEAFPIAVHTDAANAQHYELPAAFFGHILGGHRKYSCCLYDEALGGTLDEAEQRALAATAVHADLADGQRILELGCGWGSLTLWMAAQYPNARIVAVSNSNGQRLHIEAQAARRGLRNVQVLTADMNDLEPAGPFDRIVSVEMFEHMSNWIALLARARGWLTPEGALFLHVFTHRNTPYRFDTADRSDWIAQHFFTGGIMPSRRLIRQFPELFTLDAEWHWNGRHYARTANDWLANFDANEAAITPILKSVYGADATLWRRRWRLFFIATAGLFGHADGESWGVSHYRMTPMPAGSR